VESQICADVVVVLDVVESQKLGGGVGDGNFLCIEGRMGGWTEGWGGDFERREWAM